MSLVNEQWEFLRDFAELVRFVENRPREQMTGGELYRTMEQQELHIKNGKSWTMNSKHLERLAVDLNLFVNGVYVGTLPNDRQRELYEPLGHFWCGLSPLNKWGVGPERDNPTKDFNHFQRGL